jgi:subtilisin family serine protease
VLASSAAVRKEAQAALRPVLSSGWTKQVVASKRTAAETRKSKQPTPQYFWSARAAVLEVTRDELRDLPNHLPMVADIYPNRQVRVPPVSKAGEDRPAVAEYKGYTWGLSRSGALGSWGAFERKGNGIVVAVLDTGIDPTHPDLKGKIKGFAEFDNYGRVVVDNAKKAYDSDEHGTHCAGTIVGGNQSGKHIGMAPEAQILAGLVLKNGAGTDAQILAGIEWAMSKGAHVISMSLGGLRMAADVLDTYTRAIINANRMGIPVVVAVGNEGSQTTGSPGNDYFAFTVGATDVNDRAAGFSGGRTQIVEESRYIDARYLPVVFSKPDVSAPGVDIYSSVPGGKWEAWNGTSMATPHVAGAMALLLGGTSILGITGTKRVDILQNLLISSVTELGESGQNHRFGYGRIDVLRALGYAQELGYV